MALLVFNLLQNEIWACFCVNLLILGLFFRFFLPFFYLTYLLFYVFFKFPTKRTLGLFLRQITHFGLVFQICLLVFTK